MICPYLLYYDSKMPCVHLFLSSLCVSYTCYMYKSVNGWVFLGREFIKEMQVDETKIRVRYQETDQMGVVYHANYIVWFEVGRTHLIRQSGFSYRELEKQGILLPVVDVHCKYRAPARYEDEIKILTKIDELTPYKIIFSYEVKRDSDDALLAYGSTTHMWVNRDMRPTNVNRAYPELYETLTQLL